MISESQSKIIVWLHVLASDAVRSKLRTIHLTCASQCGRYMYSEILHEPVDQMINSVALPGHCMLHRVSYSSGRLASWLWGFALLPNRYSRRWADRRGKMRKDVSLLGPHWARKLLEENWRGLALERVLITFEQPELGVTSLGGRVGVAKGSLMNHCSAELRVAARMASPSSCEWSNDGREHARGNEGYDTAAIPRVVGVSCRVVSSPLAALTQL